MDSHGLVDRYTSRREPFKMPFGWTPGEWILIDGYRFMNDNQLVNNISVLTVTKYSWNWIRTCSVTLTGTSMRTGSRRPTSGGSANSRQTGIDSEIDSLRISAALLRRKKFSCRFFFVDSLGFISTAVFGTLPDSEILSHRLAVRTRLHKSLWVQNVIDNPLKSDVTSLTLPCRSNCWLLPEWTSGGRRLDAANKEKGGDKWRKRSGNISGL